jgi:hypothetical protein
MKDIHRKVIPFHTSCEASNGLKHLYNTCIPRHWIPPSHINSFSTRTSFDIFSWTLNLSFTLNSLYNIQGLNWGNHHHDYVVTVAQSPQLK